MNKIIAHLQNENDFNTVKNIIKEKGYRVDKVIYHDNINCNYLYMNNSGVFMTSSLTKWYELVSLGFFIDYYFTHNK